MQVGGHLSGGAGIERAYKISASFANAGVPTRAGATATGIRPVSTTSFADSVGLAIDTGTYSTTQGDAEGLVRVQVRPDLVIKALMAGAAAEGTAMILLSNTAAETAGTVVTDADVGTADMVSGTLWCIAGANVGQSRVITTHSASTSFTVTVPFLNDIAAADEFLFCPWSLQGDGVADLDGVGNLQTSTLFTQANAAIASGTGGAAVIVDLELNRRTDSAVHFILQDHHLLQATN